MYITTTKNEQKKKSGELQEICDYMLSFSDLLAPDPTLFSGDRNRRRSKPNLFVETVDFDEHGEEIVETTAPRGVDGTAAIQAHFQAGSTATPTHIPNFSGLPIRAVSLGYEDDDIVGWFSLDLDGGYPIEEVGRTLAEAFGSASLLQHSGSGRKGRYRVFGLLAVPLPVRRLQELLRGICTRLGFPPKSGHLEIAPAYVQSRLPGGLGGCQRFTIGTRKPKGKGDQRSFIHAALSLVPIDLKAKADELGISSNAGIDTAPSKGRGGFDPRTRRERPRPTPRRVRRRLHFGVTRSGERQDVQFVFVYDRLLSGDSMQQAIEKFISYIDDGKFDVSYDVRRYGRQWLKSQVPSIVKRIYATVRTIGMPDPIPCDGAELHRIRKIALRVHAELPEFSVRRVENFLKKILAIFKGCLAAGLPLARIHSRIWQAAGGSNYKPLRDACGIFDARSGYKSLALVMSRAHLGAKPNEAYAMSWSMSFVFDRDLPAPSYEIARSIFVSANDPTIEETFTQPTPSVPVVASFPKSSASSNAPKRSSRLYVHHLHDPLYLKGSESIPAVVVLSADEPEQTRLSIDIDYPRLDRLLLDEIYGAKRRRSELRKRKSAALRSPDAAPAKPSEWRRIARFVPPCEEDTGLGQWLDSAKSLKTEYDRLLREAKAEQNHALRSQGIRVPLSALLGKRFHELRRIFGLDPWK